MQPGAMLAQPVLGIVDISTVVATVYSLFCAASLLILVCFCSGFALLLAIAGDGNGIGP